MATTNTSEHTRPLPRSVTQLLERVRNMLRKYVALRCVLMMLCWVFVVFWIGGLVDYLPVRIGSSETPRWLRIGLLAAMVSGCLWFLLGWAAPRLWAKIQDRSLALLIERHYPALGNELVTAVELSKPASQTDLEISNPAAHARMLAKVHESCERRIGQVDTSTLFNWQPIWGFAVAVGFGLVCTILTAVAAPDWMSLWSKRLFTLSDAPWPRKSELRVDGVLLQLPAFSGQLSAERVQLPFLEGVVRVPTGAAVQLQVSAKAENKIVPDVCTMFYSSADGGRGRANLRRIGGVQDDGWQRFALDGPPLDGLSSNMNVEVIGLDARLRDLQLAVTDPAVITDLRLKCVYPAYLLASLSRPQSEQLPYRSGIRIPEGTRVTLLGKSSESLGTVEYVVRTVSSAADADEQLIVQTVTPAGSEFQIDLGLLSVSQFVEIRLRDEYGLASEKIPRYLITMQEDSVPEVSSRLAGIGNAITPVATLPIRGTVTDDNGIRKVEAEIAASDQDAVYLPIELAEETTLETEIDLRALAEQGRFTVEPGGSISLTVKAADYFNLQNATHVGEGQPQQLAIVTPDELLVLLDRQELELRQRLDLIVSELEQLRDVLQTLTSGGENAMRAQAENTAWVIAQTGSDDEQNAQSDEDAAAAAAQLQRMRVFRAQQSVLQADKSEQELIGVAAQVENLRQQLQNNRIDSYDRQTRLQEKVHQPLTELLANEFKVVEQRLLELQTATTSGGGSIQARESIQSLDEVLIKLLAIKESMLKIESFNEIIDLVRGILDDQERVLGETEAAQRQRILDLLK